MIIHFSCYFTVHRQLIEIYETCKTSSYRCYSKSLKKKKTKRERNIIKYNIEQIVHKKRRNQMKKIIRIV